jgi:hypothetical protein
MATDTKPRWATVFVDPAPSGRRGPSVAATIDRFLTAVDDGWARDRRGRGFTPEAAGDLHWYLGGHMREALGTLSLEEVRRRDVERLLHELGDLGVSRRRLRSLAVSARALFDYAIERGIVRTNPAERIVVPFDEAARHEARPAPRPLDQAIALVLRVATLGFVLTAAIFLTESL